MIRYFLIFLLFPVCAYSQPENFRFHNYGFQEGLEAASINTLAEDSFGFVWAGTDDGLYRFDGYRFRSFRESQENKSGLTNNDITALLPGENGGLWVGTRGGFFLFESTTEKFKKIFLDSADSYISKIISDQQGNLWIGSRNGLYRYNILKDEVKRYNSTENSALTHIYDVMLDHSGNLWISTSGFGLFRYNAHKDEFTQLMYDPDNAAGISSNNMRKMSLLPDGRIVIGTAANGLNILNPATLAVKKYTHRENDPSSLSAHSAYSFLTDADGRLWVGTWSNGLNLFNTGTGRATRFIHNPDDPNSIPHNAVISLMQSSTGDIWVGTDHGGLSRFNMKEQRIVRYQRNSRIDNTMLTNYVRSVYEDNDYLWIGTAQNGLHRYDRKTGEFKVFLKSDGSRDALARGTIWSMSPGKNDILWLGTSRGVGKFNRQTGSIEFYEPDDSDPGSISTNNILKVLNDGEGSLWIGTWYGGLEKMNISTGEFTHYVHNESDQGSLNSNNVKEIYRDSRGRIWVADSEHLNLLNEDNSTFTKYPFDVFGMAEDSSGNIWLGTSEGLFRFNPENGDCTLALREQDGMSSNNINSVVVDSKGFIWAGTTKGVDRINPETFGIMHLDVSGGLAGNHIDSRSSFYNEESNKVFFGGRRGLSEIDPDLFHLTPPAPNVVLTDFLLFNKSVEIGDSTHLPQSLNSLSKIRLNHNDRLVAIEFAALNFHETEKIRYEYKLEGFDEDWVSTDATDRKAVYTNLPSGRYVFNVRASNANGQFDDEMETSLSVIVVPPWWNTWWAKALLYAGIFVLGYLLFNYRLDIIQAHNKRLEEQVRLRTAEVITQKNELQKQAAQLQEINKQKNKLFSLIGHDLRSPLNSLKGILPLMDQELLTAKDLQQIRHDIGDRIDHVKNAVENLLLWAKGQLEGEVVRHIALPLSDLVKEKIELFSPEAKKKKIRLINRLTDATQIYADQNQVLIILHNLISNALKFTRENGAITIRASEVGEHVIVSVQDTGVGMSLEKSAGLFDLKTNSSTQGTAGERGVGLGMLLIKDFVDKNKGRIWLESIPDKGTTFFIAFRAVPEHKMAG